MYLFNHADICLKQQLFLAMKILRHSLYTCENYVSLLTGNNF